MPSSPTSPLLAKLTSGSAHVVVIVTDHATLDREWLLSEAQLIVDTRDALRGVSGDRTKIRTL